MRNIAFIVNPISGTKAKSRVAKLIRELLDTQQFAPTVVVTEYAGHATQLAQQFAMQDYYAVVATVYLEAKSPALCPPIPSATTKRFGNFPKGSSEVKTKS